MKKVLVVISFFLALLSCNNNKIKKPNKPENLISEDKMIAVLYDIAIVNAAKGTNKKMIENKGLNPEKFIFEKHNIDSLQFQVSNNYYSYSPEAYQDIYERVRVKLVNKKRGYQAILDLEKKKRDSLAKEARKNKDSLLKTRKPGDKADAYFVKEGSKSPSKNKKQLKQ